MIDRDRHIELRRCQAMVEAKIDSPTSKDGINFCVGECPYPYCVVVEELVRDNMRRVAALRRIVIELRRNKVSIEDIALILHISLRTTKRYIKSKGKGEGEDKGL